MNSGVKRCKKTQNTTGTTNHKKKYQRRKIRGKESQDRNYGGNRARNLVGEGQELPVGKKQIKDAQGKGKN